MPTREKKQQRVELLEVLGRHGLTDAQSQLLQRTASMTVRATAKQQCVFMPCIRMVSLQPDCGSN